MSKTKAPYAERIPLWVHLKLIKLMVGPFVWAIGRKKQTALTRNIRAVWRAL